MGRTALRTMLVCGPLLAATLSCSAQAAKPNVREDRFEANTLTVTRLTLDDGAGRRSFRRIPKVGHSLVADQRSEYDAIMAWFERR